MKGKKSKILSAGSALLTYASAVSAQSNYYSTAQEPVANFFNQITIFAFEFSNVAEVIFYFIIPLFGFYMINKMMFAKGYHVFQERISDNLPHTDDEAPTGLKGISLAVAFLMVQIFGVFGAFLLLAGGLLAYLPWVFSNYALFGGQGGGAAAGGGNDGGNTGGGQDGVERSEVEEMIENAVGETEEAEEDIEEGNVDEAEQEIQQALDAFSGAEKGILEILSMDTDELDDAILKVDNASHTIGDLEKNDVATLKQLFEELHHKIDELHSQINDDLSSITTDVTANFTDRWAEVNNPTPLKQIVGRIEEETGLIARGEKSTESQLSDAVDEMIEASEDLIRILKFEKEIEEDLGRLSQDEEKLKQVIRSSGANQNFIQRLVNEREQLEELKDNLKKIDNYDAKDKVSAALDKLEEFLEIQKSEQEDIEAIYEELITDDEKIKTVYGSLGKAYDSHPALNTFENNLQEIESELEGQIQDDLNSIKTQISVHGKHVSQAYQKLQDLAN